MYMVILLSEWVNLDWPGHLNKHRKLKFCIDGQFEEKNINIQGGEIDKKRGGDSSFRHV